MAIIANDTQFIGIAPSIDLNGKKSALLNAQTEPVTMQDIIDTAGTGSQGPQGIQGPVGPQGVPGPVGPAGLNWQGAWASGTSYVADDAVGYGGASYFCILATSGTTSPNLATANWALLASQGANGTPGATGAQGPIGPQGPQGPSGTSNPQVIDVKVTDGTAVTGTTNAAISQSIRIPANTFTASGGMLEFMARYQKTGFAGIQSTNVYLNTTLSLSGATALAWFSSTSPTFVQGIRTARINSNILTIYTANSTALTDYSVTSNAQTSVAFDTSVDNYLLFTITLTNASDSSVVEMARATKYE
jgi:hypothetical protein